MPFALQFFKGSLDGRRFAAGAEPLFVGRSHSCAARPSEPDVSGRHVAVSAAGEAIAVQVLSAHRTKIDGRPAAKGDIVAVAPGSVVELGSALAFRVVEDLAPADGETGVMQGETGLFPAAAGGSAARETGIPPTAPGTGAATTFATAVPTSRSGSAPTVFGTSLTVAAGAARDRAPDASTGSAFTMAGETSVQTEELSTGGQESGETQILQTQAVSREELEELKKLFDAKKSRKTASKFALAGIAAAAALGVSLWASTREPEKELALPKAAESGAWKFLGVLPAMEPGSVKAEGAVFFRYPYPAVAAESGVRTNSLGWISRSVRTFVGRNRDVELDLAVDVFRDPAALNESRADSFLRYLDNSPDLVSTDGNRVALSDEDFFGGGGGLRRAVPCSRMAYWRLRGEQSVFGVVSFFRTGDLCCAFRREVPATEQLRAERILQNTRVWLRQDAAGAFGAAQWEGASGAGCDNPQLLFQRCQSAFDRDTPSEWPDIEAGLRDVLVETSSGDGRGAVDDAGRAVSLLKDLRARKIRHWKAFVAARVPLAASGGDRGGEADARALDRAVREAYTSPDEEWWSLARRAKWWENR